MSSLTSCIKKAGKALSKDDAALVRQIYDDLVAEGVENPAQAAVTEVIENLQFERQMMLEQIELQGGRGGSSIVFAKPPLKAIAEKISIVGLLDGNETLEIPDAKITKAGKLKATARQLAIALVERTKRANQGKPLSAKTPRTKEIVAEAIAIETEAAINRSGHAGDWYSSVLVAAVNIAAEIHPELKTDVNMRNVFMLGLAITSNGNTVADNARAAEEVYAHFKKTGQFLVKNYGNQGTKPHFKLANAMLERWGLDTFVRFLNTDFTIGELTKLGFTASGDHPTFQTKGSAVFGPKIGAGFFQNLMGNFDPITMDRWFMRTWGRLTGTLMPLIEDVRATDKFDRFVQAVRDYPKQVKALGFDPDAVLATEDSLLEFAAAVHKAYANSSDMWWGEIINDKKKVVGKRQEFDSQEKRDAWIEKQQAAGKKTRKGNNTFADKNELNYAGKNLDMAINAPIIAPVSPAQRAWIRKVTELALEKLVERGVPANSASMQALVWYPEKDLYLNHGVGSAKSAPTDYAQEFEKLALERGVSQRRINAAKSAVGRTGAVRPRAEDTGTAAEREGDTPTLGPKGKERLAQLELFRGLREQFSRTFRGVVPKGKQKLLDGVPVIQILKPIIQARNVLKKLSMTPIEFSQIDSTKGAQLFHDAISAVKAEHSQGAAVYVYDVEDYKDMQLYLTPDKKIGFAVKSNGDIVSLFKEEALTEVKGAAHSAVMAAVAEGGTRLDAYDTILPFMYSMQGFEVVARIDFKEGLNPDWREADFADYNEGRPDVIFMVFDRGRKFGYTGRNEGKRVRSEKAAVELQEQAVIDKAARNENVPNILYRIDEETIQAINENPQGAVPQLTKLALSAEAQRGQAAAKRGLPALWSQLRDMDTPGITKVLALVPRRNLIDYLPKSLVPSLSKNIRLSNEQEGRRNELMYPFEQLAKRWTSFARKDQAGAAILGELMHVSTLAGLDPSKPYRSLKDPKKMTLQDKKHDMLRRENYERLKKVFNELPAEAQELYQEVRDSYIEMRKMSWAALEQRINDSEAKMATKKSLLDKLRMKFEAGRVEGVYFPLMRFGQWYSAVYDAEGKVLSFSRFEKEKERAEWEAEWRSKGYTEFKRGKRSDADVAGVLRDVDPAFMADLSGLLEETDNAGIMDEVWQMYLSQLPEMSIRKQFMHRKGRMGFAADALRAYATVAYRNANQISKMEYNYKIRASLNELRKEIQAIENDEEQKHNWHWAMPVYDELARRFELEQQHNAHPLSTKATAAGFLFFLGFSPASAAINLTQTPLVAYPTLAAKFGWIKSAARLIEVFALWATSYGPIENRLRGEEREAVLRARKNGLLETTLSHQLAGLQERDASIKTDRMTQIMEMSSWMFHKIEVANREMTFLAGYRLARDAKMSHSDAIVLAEDMTWDSHFDYSNPNRPPVMQGDWSRVILLFKQYSLNMTYRLTRDARDAAFDFGPGERTMANRNITRAESAEARRRFGGMLVMSFMLSGVAGMWTPVKMIVDFVVKALLADDEDDELYSADALLRAYLFEVAGEDEFAEWFSQFIVKGPVESSTGMSVSQRTALNQLWLRDPHYAATPRDQAEQYAREAAGPVVGHMLQVLMSLHSLSGHYSGGTPLPNPYVELEKMMPKFLRDASKAVRQNVQGVTKSDLQQTPIITPEEYGWVESLSRLGGFTPALETERYERRGAIEGAQYKKQKQRKNIVDRYFLAVHTQDKKEIEKAKKAINDWNTNRAKTATEMITGVTLGTAVVSRLKREALTVEGTYLDPRDKYLMDKMIWTTEQAEEE